MLPPKERPDLHQGTRAVRAILVRRLDLGRSYTAPSDKSVLVTVLRSVRLF